MVIGLVFPQRERGSERRQKEIMNCCLVEAMFCGLGLLRHYARVYTDIGANVCARVSTCTVVSFDCAAAIIKVFLTGRGLLCSYYDVLDCARVY